MNAGRPARLGSIRLRQAWRLAPLTIRTIRLLPIAATGALSFLLVFMAHHDHSGGLQHVPQAAMFLSIGCGFVLDDPAEATIAGVPPVLLYRRVLRLALAIPFLAVVWASLLWYARVDGTTGALTVELAAMAAIAVGIAAIASHVVPDGLGGVAAGPSVLVLFVTVALLPRRYARFLPLDPTGPRRFDLYGRWALALAVAAAVFVAASLDPARRSRIPRGGSRAQGRRVLGAATRAPAGGKP